MLQDTSGQETAITKDSNSPKSRSRRLIETSLSSVVLAAFLAPGGLANNIFIATINGLPLRTSLNPASISQFKQVQETFGEKVGMAEDCIQPDKFKNFNSSGKKLTVDSALCASSNRVAIYIKGPDFPNGTYQFVPIRSAQAKASVDFWVQKAVAATPLVRAPITAPATYASTVVCQKQLNGGLLLRRIKNDDGSCTDETIDLTTGNVTKREKASTCSGDCS